MKRSILPARSLLTGLSVSALLFSVLYGCGYKPVSPPDIKYISAPTGAMDIAMMLPPGYGGAVIAKSVVRYEIANRSCIPIDQTLAIGGVRPNFTIEEPIELVASEPFRFTGRAFRNKILPENYYGLGVCRWRLALDIIVQGKPSLSVFVDGEDLPSNGELQLACLEHGGPGRADAYCLTPSEVSEAKMEPSLSVVLKVSENK